MKHISIGGLDVSRIGLGAMSMAGYYNIGSGSDAESIRTIHRALHRPECPARSVGLVTPREWGNTLFVDTTEHTGCYKRNECEP
jgi:hypothetical protein